MVKKYFIIPTMFFILLTGISYGSQISPLRIIKKNPPFLITRGLPHLIGALRSNWNNPKLHLTVKQKRELRRIERDTINGLLKLTKKINKLERFVIKSVKRGVEPYKLYGVIDRIAKLKSEATKIHLRCLYEIRLILTEKQLKLIERAVKHRQQ